MAQPDSPLKLLDVGPYAELAARPNPHRFVIQPIPSLSAILLSAEGSKGSALSRAEVEALRDNATVMVVGREAAESVDLRRGYRDLNPFHAWDEWQLARKQFQ
jgi:hypothetical protein